jgi:hypothetical protein
MKSMLIAIAIVLASGLLVASGAEASGGNCVTLPQGHRVDIMGPQYNSGLFPVVQAGRSESELFPSQAAEMVPAGSGQGVDILGPQYNSGLLPSTPRSEGRMEMIPAGAEAGGGYCVIAPQARRVDIMGPHYNSGLLPATFRSEGRMETVPVG